MTYFLSPVLRPETVLMEEMFVYICSISFTLAHTEAAEEETHRIHPGFKAVHQDFPATVEKETRGKEKRERTSETPASTVIPPHRPRTGKQAVFIFPDQVSGQHLCAWLTLDLWK